MCAHTHSAHSLSHHQKVVALRGIFQLLVHRVDHFTPKIGQIHVHQPHQRPVYRHLGIVTTNMYAVMYSHVSFARIIYIIRPRWGDPPRRMECARTWLIMVSDRPIIAQVEIVGIPKCEKPQCKSEALGKP